MTRMLESLQRSQLFIENAVNNVLVREYLASKNILAEDLEQGLPMIEKTREALNARDALRLDRVGLTKQVVTEYRALKWDVATVRFAVESAFEDRPEVLVALGISRGSRKAPAVASPPAGAGTPAAGAPAEPEVGAKKARRSLLGFLAASASFLGRLLQNAEIVAAVERGSFKIDEISKLAARVEALRGAHEAREGVRGKVRTATQTFRELRAEFVKWLRPRRRRIVRALRSRDDLRTALGKAA